MNDFIRNWYYILAVICGGSIAIANLSWQWATLTCVLIIITAIVAFIKSISKSDLNDEERRLIFRMQPNIECSIPMTSGIVGLNFAGLEDQSFEFREGRYILECLIEKDYVFEYGLNIRLFKLTHKGRTVQRSWFILDHP